MPRSSAANSAEVTNITATEHDGKINLMATAPDTHRPDQMREMAGPRAYKEEAGEEKRCVMSNQITDIEDQLDKERKQQQKELVDK